MTVPTTTSAAVYTGTGVLASYPFTWLVPAAADVIVYRQDTAGNIALLALTTDYTVSGVGNPTGGTITLVAGNLTTGYRLFIASDPAEIQPLLIAQGSGWNPADLMAQLDQLTRMVQAARRVAQNAIGVPLAESLDGRTVTLPPAAQRANTFLSFDGAGNVAPGTPAFATIPAASLVQTVDTIAALKAIVSPVGTLTYLVRGYYAAGDGGGGTFRWNAGDVTADNGGTVIAPTVGAGRFWRIYEARMTPLWFGAKGDKTTNDAVAVQAALTQINADGGGELWLPGNKSFRCTAALQLYSGTKLSGPGVLYLDPAANINKGIYALGSANGLVSLTANCSAGTYTCTIAAGAAAANSIAAGSVCILNSNKLGGKYPQPAMEVQSVTPGGGVAGGDLITFLGSVPCDFLTADTAKIKSINTVSNITLDGVRVQCSPTSDIDYVMRFDYFRDISVTGVRSTGHRAITNPTLCSGCTLVNGLGFDASRNLFECVSSDGNGIGFASGSLGTIAGNKVYNYGFGIGVFTGTDLAVTGNTLRGPTPAVVGRALKVQSCWDVTFTGNAAEAFETGFKVEDSSYVTVVGNELTNIGIDASSIAINVSNQAATAGEVGRHVISGNIIRNCTGAGIYVDSGADYVEAIGNEIDTVQACGIQITGNNCLVHGNLVKDWGLGYVGINIDFFAGVRLDDRGSVKNNRFVNTVLTTVPAVALGNPANQEEIADNYSPTNNILYLSALTAAIELNGTTLGTFRAAAPLVSLPWIGSVGGNLTTKAFANNTSFTVTTYGEGKFFTISAFGKSGVFFADNNTAAVTIVADPSGLFSAVNNNAGTINVTRSGNVITVQNKVGSDAAGVSIAFVGTRVLSATNPA